MGDYSTLRVEKFFAWGGCAIMEVVIDYPLSPMATGTMPTEYGAMDSKTSLGL